MRKQSYLIFLIPILLPLFPHQLNAQIAARADFDKSGRVDFADFIAFSSAFSTEEAQYDLDGSGTVDFPDFLAFASLFGKSVIDHDMVLIPGGSFPMGSESGDPDERPSHSVSLDAFHLDRYEVTNAQYLAFLNANGKNADSEGNELLDFDSMDGSEQIREEVTGRFSLKETEYAYRPVVKITWFGARAYCAWIGGRLPTEAEWERAARSGEGRLYPWGNDLPTTDRLNFNRLIGHSVDVGSKPDGATELGIHDLAGNVWEWVHDRYGESYYSSSAGTNPKGPETGDERVRRGGSWADTEDLIRSANRNRARPANSFGDVGFRCARTPDGVTDPPHSFALSGRITADGSGIGDIRVRLTGDMDATMSTIVSSGTFSFDLPDGSYTITPEKEGFAFLPESRTVIISGGNITGVDFNGMRTTSPPDTFDSSLPGAGEYEWVLIPAGSFPMGSEAGDIGERPVHRVNLKSYEIGKYEVTNVQYLAFLVAKRETSDRDGNEYLNLGVKNLHIQQMDTSFSLKNSAFATHPVVELTWYGAKAFCEWIGGRLPTEAEWEKAARGTDERIYPWGGELDGRRANYQNSGDPYDNSTAPVGYFDGSLRDGYQTLNGASPYGLYDVAGNVYEWVQDWYGEDYYSKSPEDNPMGPETGESKVNRGGSYDYHPFIIRSSHRSWYQPHVADDRQGFRCAKSLP